MHHGQNVLTVKFDKGCNADLESSKGNWSAWANNTQFISEFQEYDLRDYNILFKYDNKRLIATYDWNLEMFYAQCYHDAAFVIKNVSQDAIARAVLIHLRSDVRVGNILEDLDVLLQNETVPLICDKLEFLMDEVDSLLEPERNASIPGRLLKQLDELGKRLEVEEETGKMVRPNFAVLLANMSSERGVRGVRVDSSDDHLFTTDMFHFINETSEYMSTSYTDAMAILPDSVVLSRRRVNFVAFRTDQAFAQDRSCEVNSHVLGITVSNFTDFEEGEVVQIYLNPFIRDVKRNQERVCAYWHFDEDGSGHWSQDGCTLTISEEGQLDLCLCDHLTHFAQIIVSKTVFSDLNEAVLEILSIIGCCLSIFGITIIVITAAAFKSWRSNDRNKIWIIYVYLCLAVFLLSLCFLLTVFIKFEQANFTCVFVGALLHYSVLSTYCWMLVISILSFRKLALVFASEIPHALVLGSVFAWCTPVLVIGILLAVDPLAYSTKYEENTLSGHFCYPKGIALWATVIAPIGLMWFVNWCLYGIMIKSMSASKDIRRHSNSKDNVKSASINFLLAFLCGIPWLSGFFAWNIVAAYIFTLTVSFQGFVLFLLFILGNDRTRNLWVNFFRRKIFRRSYLVAPSDDKPHGSDDKDQYQGVNASTPLTESQL